MKENNGPGLVPVLPEIEWAAFSINNTVTHILYVTAIPQEDVISPMESEAKYQALFGHMPLGFAYHEIITDDAGIPIDYTFLEINNEYTRMTGISPDRSATL